MPPEDVVRGYQCRDGSFVTLSDEDFARANPKATQTIEIVAFVAAGEIDVTFYERPYYLVPAKSGRKAYVLLREALRRSGRAGIATVVIRTRQYLAALVPHNDALVLELLRFAHELRPVEDLDLPGDDLEALGISDREMAMAEQLVQLMAAPWDPGQYRDEYRDDLLRMIEQKAKAAGVTQVAKAAAMGASSGEVVDIVALLKRSVEQRRARERKTNASGRGVT